MSKFFVYLPMSFFFYSVIEPESSTLEQSKNLCLHRNKESFISVEQIRHRARHNISPPPPTPPLPKYLSIKARKRDVYVSINTYILSHCIVALVMALSKLADSLLLRQEGVGGVNIFELFGTPINYKLMYNILEHSGTWQQ
jgi:hypothetical protein